jgi:toxin ParE1/3/4
MMRQIRITEPAQEDLEAIWQYVAQHQVEAANRLIEEIFKKFSTLRDHPYIGRQRDDLLINLRSFVVRNYLLFYQPVEDGIEVLRVIHGSRDIEGLFESFFDSL